MKPAILLLFSLFAISATLTTPAFSQHIVGYTSLGAVQTSGGNQIAEAPNPVTNKIYVSNTTAPGTVMVVSGTTHAVTATITVGSGSPLIRVNSTTNTIYALNADQTISVIDGSVDQVIATIPPVTSDGCIVQMAVDEGANKLVVLDNCSKAAYVLDGSSYALLSTISVPVIYMLDAKVNPSTHLLYVCDDIDHLYIVADLTAATSTTINLSTFWPQSIAIDPALNRIYMPMPYSPRSMYSMAPPTLCSPRSSPPRCLQRKRKYEEPRHRGQRRRPHDLLLPWLQLFPGRQREFFLSPGNAVVLQQLCQQSLLHWIAAAELAGVHTGADVVVIL